MLGPKDIDVSKVTNNQKYAVLWKGQPIDHLSYEKVGGSKSKIIALTLDIIINRDGKKCRRCPREEWLTLDHIVPLSLLRDMGIDDLETYRDHDNFQLLCKPCNQFKSNRLDFSDPRTKQLLIKYLQQL